MTIDLQEISHASTLEALGYAQDYYTNYYSPAYPPFTYHRYDHSEHIEVLAAWGYQGYFFVQSRIKLTVLYALVAHWTDEIAMRGWIFWRNPITGVWHTIVDSQETSVHHWQQAHAHIKEEAEDMPLKRARIDAYYPATHTADVTIYPLPGEEMEGVGLAQEIGPQLPALLPDCTLAIFYDVEPPIAVITSIINGVPPPWITSALVKDGEIAEGDLAFDPATQAELDAHADLPWAHHDPPAVYWARAVGDTILTTTDQDIFGCQLILPPGAYLIFGCFCIEGDRTGVTAIGRLMVGAATQPEEARYGPNESKDGVAHPGQIWFAYVEAMTWVKLRASKTDALGDFTVLGTHTTIAAISTPLLGP